MTEGRKDDKGKPRMDLLPPKALLEVGEVLAHGAQKYGENNWRLVENAKERYLAAALRHVFQWRAGEELDPESGLSHLAHAATNLIFMMEVGK